MAKTIEKKKPAVKAEPLTAPLEPVSLQYNPAAFHANTTPCRACGAGQSPRDEPHDLYDLTLRNEAARVIHHASARVGSISDANETAGMLRDAARLLDLLGARQRAREAVDEAARDAREARRSRKAAVR